MYEFSTFLVTTTNCTAELYMLPSFTGMYIYPRDDHGAYEIKRAEEKEPASCIVVPLEKIKMTAF